jgi:hypothetical protein
MPLLRAVQDLGTHRANLCTSAMGTRLHCHQEGGRMNSTLVNKTPHPIAIYSQDTPQIGATAEQLAAGVVGVIPPSGKPARLATIELGTWYHARYVDAADDTLNGFPVGVEGVEFGHVHDLPTPRDGVCFIVALVVGLACRGRSDLLVPYLDVRNQAGTVVGCKMLAHPA